MSKREAPLEAIKRYIPAAAAQPILDYLNRYRVHLTVTRERKTVLGDYRHATHYQNHRITVNGNLNPYSFLITLIHELAHLETFLRYNNRVEPHGREWKKVYSTLLAQFMLPDIFPVELLTALKQSIHDLPASSCSDEKLMRVLKKFDPVQNGLVMVEQIGEGQSFDAGKGRIFRKGRKLRKRFQCVEIATGRVYLFSPIYEVKAVN